jgi:hypothetical protein
MTDDAALDILRERSGRMYDPQVVETFIRVYRDIPVAHIESSEQREVMRQITQSRHEVVDTPQDSALDSTSASGNLLAFVSLSRLVSGEGNLDDVLALSTRLITDVIPASSGAWYLPDSGTDRLVATETFGPAAAVLRGVSVEVGERLTGWVAASRLPILNSDAALDLGPRAEAASPPLRGCMSVPITVIAEVIDLSRGGWMRTADPAQQVRGLTISAFVLDGIAALGFMAMILFGDGRMSPLDGVVLAALLLGFFSALGSLLIASPPPEAVMVHAGTLAERRRFDRRVINLGSPTGIERRSGRDRRLSDLTLGAMLAPSARTDFPNRS